MINSCSMSLTSRLRDFVVNNPVTHDICIIFVQCWTTSSTLGRGCTNVIQMIYVCWKVGGSSTLTTDHSMNHLDINHSLHIIICVNIPASDITERKNKMRGDDSLVFVPYFWHRMARSISDYFDLNILTGKYVVKIRLVKVFQREDDFTALTVYSQSASQTKRA